MREFVKYRLNARFLNEYLKKIGLGMGELSHRMGMSRSYLWNIVNAQSGKITESCARKLSELLDLDIDEFTTSLNEPFQSYKKKRVRAIYDTVRDVGWIIEADYIYKPDDIPIIEWWYLEFIPNGGFEIFRNKETICTI